jgi:hypothetical protein
MMSVLWVFALENPYPIETIRLCVADQNLMFRYELWIYKSWERLPY